jgi:aspartate aminotransferase-like enzyme
MEAVARQFANGEHCLVVRNGWFSYRWTQILDAGGIPASHTVLKARAVEEGRQAFFAPAPIDEVETTIASERPAVVFAPHVETSAGMILPADYIRRVADATHAVGGLFVLDCIASGTIWVDMASLGVDVLCSAPQKGWSASPCAGLVMMNERARARMENTASSSFACDLKKWTEIMEAYEGGGHAYHATMPTDALIVFRSVMAEAEMYGFENLKSEQQELGDRVRALLGQFGFKSLAAPGFEAPGVVVAYTDDPLIKNGSKFAAAGVQIAAGVPLACDEPTDFSTFRMGLFGLDKLHNIDRTVALLENTFGVILSS